MVTYYQALCQQCQVSSRLSPQRSKHLAHNAKGNFAQISVYYCTKLVRLLPESESQLSYKLCSYKKKECLPPTHHYQELF